MLGMTNAGGLTAYKANQALIIANEAKQIAEQGGGGGGNSFGVGDVTNIVSTTASGTVALKWTDPEDLTLNGVTLAKWAGTKAVRKAGSAPENVNDGDLVVDNTTRNAYSSTALEDTGLTNDVSYYYGFFPYTTKGVYTTGTVKKKTPSDKPAATLTLSQNSVTLTSGGLAAIVTITSNSDGEISITSSDTDEDYIQAVLENNTITLTAVNVGTATIRVSQGNGTDYVAPDDVILTVSVQTFPANIANATPSQIQAAIDAGVASTIWDVGDSVPIKLNGTVGVHTFNNETWYASILGFNHNKEIETNGKDSIHFIFGKNANGVDIAFCDSRYGTSYSQAFCMNTTNVNNGGWQASRMRNTTMPQFINAMPTEWQDALAKVTKYSSSGIWYEDNYGGSVLQKMLDAAVPSIDKVFLLSEFEVQRARTFTVTSEQYYQQQYDYYKNGNSKIRYNHNDGTTAVKWWLRSAYYLDPRYFCNVSTTGSASADGAIGSNGFAPGFALIGKS